MIDWGALGLLILLVAGHTTLWASVINRLHSFPLPEKRLKRLRHAHDVIIVLFPIVLFAGIGIGPNGLLRGGSWSSLDWWWQVVVALGGLGCIVLLAKFIRYQWHRPPRQLVHETATVVDIEQKLGQKPVDHGPYHFMIHVPGNDQFRVEFSEKTLLLPRLPTEWDGLSLLHLSDWHFSGTITRSYYEQVTEIIQQQPVDLVCFTGDLIDDLSLVDWIPETLGRLTGRYGQFFILGNHDWNQGTEPTRSCLTGLGWQDLGSKVQIVEIEERRLALGGDETPWLGTAPTLPPETDFRLLLSHTPDNIRRARRQDVDLMLSGHTHGGQVRLPLIGPVFAPSWYGCKYASGLFWESPTFLVVSRGLAGIHPLRYRCLPEVSRLILRSGMPTPP